MQCTHAHTLDRVRENEPKHKRVLFTWLSWGRINIVKTLHYANMLWFLSDSAGKLDDVLWWCKSELRQGRSVHLKPSLICVFLLNWAPISQLGDAFGVLASQRFPQAVTSLGVQAQRVNKTIKQHWISLRMNRGKMLAVSADCVKAYYWHKGIGNVFRPAAAHLAVIFTELKRKKKKKRSAFLVRFAVLRTNKDKRIIRKVRRLKINTN